MADTEIGGMEGGDLGLTPAGTELLWLQNAGGTVDYKWPIDTAGVVYRRRGIITDSTTTRTLAASDDGQHIRFTNAAGCAVTIPKNSDVALPVGFRCSLRQTIAGSAGLVTTVLGGAPPVTLNLPTGIRPARFMGAQAKKSADETGANYQGTKIVPFDGTDVQDTDGFHNPSTNNERMTIPSGLGIRKVRLMATWDLALVHNLTYTALYIQKNGADYDGMAAKTTDDMDGGSPRFNVRTQSICTDGDYFRLLGQTENDTSITVLAATTNFVLEVISIDAQGTSAGKDTEFWVEKVATDEWNIGGMFM
jgi:hypothetical protein